MRLIIAEKHSVGQAIAQAVGGVQNRVRSDHQLGKAVPKRKSTAAVWLSNLLLFTVVFSALGLALRGVLNLDGYRWVSHADGLSVFKVRCWIWQ